MLTIFRAMPIGTITKFGMDIAREGLGTELQKPEPSKSRKARGNNMRQYCLPLVRCSIFDDTGWDTCDSSQWSTASSWA